MVHLDVLTFVTLLTIGASAQDPSSTTPPPVDPRTLPARAITDINVPIEIAVRDLEQTLDAQFAGGDPEGQLFFASGIPIHPGTAQVEVRRHGALSLEVSPGGVIRLALPVRIDARGDWETPKRVKLDGGFFRVSFKTIQVKHHEATTAYLTLRAAITLGVSPAWTVQTDTQISFSWDQKPVVDVGPFAISLGGIAGRHIDKLLVDAAPRLDAAIAQKVPLRSTLENFWRVMHRPVRLGASPDAWLQIEPLEIHFANVTGAGGAAVFPLHLQAYITTIVGTAPPSVRLRPLPPPDTKPRKTRGIRIHAEQRIAIVAIEEAVGRALATSSFDLPTPGAAIPVKMANFSLRGMGPALVASLTFSVDLPGRTLTLPATVSMEPTSGPGGTSLGLAVTEVKLDWASTNADTIGWVDGPLTALLARVLGSQVLSLSRVTEPLRARLQQRLGMVQLAPGVDLATTLDKVGIGDIRIEGTELRCELVVLGDAQATITPAALQGTMPGDIVRP